MAAVLAGVALTLTPAETMTLPASVLALRPLLLTAQMLILLSAIALLWGARRGSR